MNFNELGLSPELLQAITDTGYTTPTPIQEQAIPVVAQGRDVLGCAQTGTGKTASFALPMIDKLAAGRARARMPRSLILEPTRELATQVEASFERYGKNHRLSTALLIGGESFGDQERKLDRGVDVLIATPGRLIDLFERGKVLLSDVRILVIDEADRMLDMGFKPAVDRIVARTPRDRQTLFFSATLEAAAGKQARAYTRDARRHVHEPQTNDVGKRSHRFVHLPHQAKMDALVDELRNPERGRTLVFVRTKRGADRLVKRLARAGVEAAAMHGDKSQRQREAALARFEAGKVRTLVATDVAARGIDVDGIEHVINFDPPADREGYVHRVGRTGRAGRTGTGTTFVRTEDAHEMRRIAVALELHDEFARAHPSAPRSRRRR
jgi:superfamily II DNA/RNA helicase